MKKISIKTKDEIEIMKEGGEKLGRVKKKLAEAVKPGVSAWDIEELANKLIEEEGALASFKKVPNYKWATCINVNDGVVHGIPKKTTIFKEGDVVSVDVGIYYRGFHTDTALSVCLSQDPEKKKFIEVGRKAMLDGIKEVKKGKKIGDISAAIEKRLFANNLRPVWNLTGHGVGRDLHEEPNIPCFASDEPSQDIVIGEGMALAVEVMFTFGNGDLKQDADGWTLRTKDGKIAGLWEETVAITRSGPIVL
ncbi:MAG TPA: type I methionyl aminopeptidase, partial [Candidatus Saccharimonadales bacterium]|nr:type I methionyl aminopeptidase [Candidatus Saccharimonadales bacterium]